VPSRSSSSSSADRHALSELVARHLPALRRWAHGRLPRWARSAADTTDLIHDTLVGTFRRLERLEPRGQDALSAYLREAVRNRIRDEHRRVARRGVPQPLETSLTDPRPSPLDRTMSRDLEARYRAALSRLTPGERDLVVGHIELAYNHAQLGHMTGRSPHAARMALRRAIARLAILMREQ
jgi:RNA polymerase sigma factor (sigma-70 family)